LNLRTCQHLRNPKNTKRRSQGQENSKTTEDDHQAQASPRTKRVKCWKWYYQGEEVKKERGEFKIYLDTLPTNCRQFSLLLNDEEMDFLEGSPIMLDVKKR
jgi:hypothetical protein